LLGGTDLRALAEAPDAFAFIATLERSPDWRPVFHEVAPLGAEPGAAAEAAIERHRGERLGLLPRLYDDTDRRLVEALVLGLDQERVLAVLRRRRGGESAESIGATIVRGALLDAEALGRLARAPFPALIDVIASTGLIGREDRAKLVDAASDRSRPEVFEAAFTAACDRARDRRADGRGTDQELVRQTLAHERTDRARIVDELRDNGPLAASLAERAAALERFDDLARRGRRHPLGVGTVIGYIAALEAQAVRLRAVLARVRAEWPVDALDPYLGRSGGRRWPALSS
jgi:hypothetical protein